jgi:antitoxin component YwqK of YwqJK toxin-antitoxin module
LTLYSCEDLVQKQSASFLNDSIRWQGSVINGKKEGVWKEYYNNGKLKSIANYKNGFKEGQEKSYYPNGNVYNEMSYKQNHFTVQLNFTILMAN